MSTVAEGSRLTGRAVSTVSLAAVAILCDVAVAVTAYSDWCALDAAPGNASVLPGDNPTFVLASLVYVASSAVRYLVLVGLIVMLLLCEVSRRSPVAVVIARRRRRWLLAGALVATEAGYMATNWTETSPGGDWFLARLVTLIISALLCASTAVVVLRRPGRQLLDLNVARQHA